MTYVIQIIEVARTGSTEHAGRFVCRYDPDYLNGLGRVWSCPDEEDALHFESFQQAAKFWSQTSTVRPLREDGKPNRPLTAYTINIMPALVLRSVRQ